MRPDLIFTYIAGQEIPPGMQNALNQGYKIFDFKQTAQYLDNGGSTVYDNSNYRYGKVFITVVLRYKV